MRVGCLGIRSITSKIPHFLPCTVVLEVYGLLTGFLSIDYPKTQAGRRWEIQLAMAGVAMPTTWRRDRCYRLG